METTNTVNGAAAVVAMLACDLGFESLEETKSGADFREVAVWSVRRVLDAAFEAGAREAGLSRRGQSRAVVRVARMVLGFESLKETHSGADFREVAVWSVRRALETAFMAGGAARGL